ncbi:AAA family ATPase [Streptomyces antimycoticus]|uniref:AAA family ATPase n=1 Tax=Streptomyces antimycoticus TaxID=68175 RepID=UPI003F4DDB84
MAALSSTTRTCLPGTSDRYSGSVCISGPTVQARDVQGGIHFHHTGPSRPPIPRQLPPVSAHFVGREDELTALDSCRAAHPEKSPLLMVISGPAGIGKTALASRWVDGLAAEFPDGQLYADLGGYSPLRAIVLRRSTGAVPACPGGSRRAGPDGGTYDAVTFLHDEPAPGRYAGQRVHRRSGAPSGPQWYGKHDGSHQPTWSEQPGGRRCVPPPGRGAEARGCHGATPPWRWRQPAVVVLSFLP